jgi:hypothetical protein
MKRRSDDSTGSRAGTKVRLRPGLRAQGGDDAGVVGTSPVTTTSSEETRSLASSREKSSASATCRARRPRIVRSSPSADGCPVSRAVTPSWVATSGGWRSGWNPRSASSARGTERHRDATEPRGGHGSCVRSGQRPGDRRSRRHDARRRARCGWRVAGAAPRARAAIWASRRAMGRPAPACAPTGRHRSAAFGENGLPRAATLGGHGTHPVCRCDCIRVDASPSQPGRRSPCVRAAEPPRTRSGRPVGYGSWVDAGPPSGL